VVKTSSAGVLQLLRGAVQHAGAKILSVVRVPNLAQVAPATKPKRAQTDLGKVRADHGEMVTSPASETPLAQCAISLPTPKVGAVCASSARTDLYGGCPARGIPTVTKRDEQDLQIDIRSFQTSTPIHASGWTISEVVRSHILSNT